MSTPRGGDRRDPEPPRRWWEEGRSHSQTQLRGFSVNMLEPPADTHYPPLLQSPQWEHCSHLAVLLWMEGVVALVHSLNSQREKKTEKAYLTNKLWFCEQAHCTYFHETANKYCRAGFKNIRADQKPHVQKDSVQQQFMQLSVLRRCMRSASRVWAGIQRQEETQRHAGEETGGLSFLFNIP